MSKYNVYVGDVSVEAVFNKLGGIEGSKRLLSNKLALVDPTKAKKGAKMPALFTFAGTFKTEGTKKFVAAKNYVINTDENARVRISYIGGNFKTYLLSKVEHDIAASDLNLQKLRRSSIDLPKNADEPGTIAGLGGLEKAETGLYEFFETLAHKQATKDFSWVVGYVRDDNNVLWAVHARWNDDGWLVEAYSVTNPCSWGADDGFVSR